MPKKPVTELSRWRISHIKALLLVAMTVGVMLNPIPSSANSRQVRVVNETGYGITFIGVNVPGHENWINNRIMSVIRHGTSTQVDLTTDGKCERDIRIAWERNIASTTLKSVDLCSVRFFTLHYNRETGTVSYEKR